MRNLFHSGNPVMRFLSRFCDIMFLNSLFILTSIPVLTMGAALTGMYGIVLKWLNDEDPYISKCYFQIFKSCFKKATFLWIPILIGFVFFSIDLYIIYHVINPSYFYLQIPVWFFIFLLLSLVIYAFPLLSTYECSIKQLLKNSVLLSIANLPTTIFFLALALFIIKISSLSAKNFVVIISLFLFFGCAASALFCSLFLDRIFKKCMDQKKDAD